MKKDIITMSKQELKRLPIIHKVIEKRLTQVKAAEMLDLTDRQIRRIVVKIKKGGDQSIVNANRGKPSLFRLPDKKAEEIRKIVEKRYSDFGPTFAAEKLWECEKLKIGKEKLRLLMIAWDIWHTKSRKKGKVHPWRERKHHRGEMIQMDGSHHDWLEGRGPKLVLVGYIDDATNQIYAYFYEYEGTFPAMDSFKRYIAKQGIPISLYLDKHSAYKTTRQPNLEEDLKGEFAKTQFARALNELGVKTIFAHSPQAKGRVERLFDTLQDRLTKEMRLAGVKSINEANLFMETYLPKHNARFAIKPFKQTNLHRSVPKKLNLDEIFCIKEYRSISDGYTLKWKNRMFLIKDPSITMKKQRACIIQAFDRKTTIKLKDKYLSFVEITAKNLQSIARDQKSAQKLIRKTRVYLQPKNDHPWRRWIPSKKESLICA